MRIINEQIKEEDDLLIEENEIRWLLTVGDIGGAMDHFDSFGYLSEEDRINLWFRFKANERSAMKERREVRKGRK